MSNISPIANLAGFGQLDLLRQLYSNITVEGGKAIEQEVLAGLVGDPGIIAQVLKPGNY